MFTQKGRRLFLEKALMSLGEQNEKVKRAFNAEIYLDPPHFDRAQLLINKCKETINELELFVETAEISLTHHKQIAKNTGD